MSSFIAVDFETANSNRASACAIGLVKVVDGKVVETFESLIKPAPGLDYFDPRNVEIHGISERDVRNAPTFAEIWPQLHATFDGLPLVAHNAGFDISVLSKTLASHEIQTEAISFFCTLVFCRRLLNLVTFKLPFVAKELGVSLENHHDALSDAKAAAEIAIALLEKNGVATLDELSSTLKISKGRLEGSLYLGSQFQGTETHSVSKAELEKIRATSDPSLFNPDHPLFGRQVVFTGTLMSMRREDAQRAAIAVGAIAGTGVTAKTDFLVVGTQDSRMLKPGAVNSSKFVKAENLHASGSPIEVIDELTFLTLLES